MSSNILGKRLSRARKALGFSLRSLAEKIGVSHMAIKKYEEGKLFPSSDILLKIAQELNVPVEFLIRPETVHLGEIKFRKRHGLNKKKVESIKIQISDQIERRIELENLFPYPFHSFRAPSEFPKIIKKNEQIEDVANQLRKQWELGSAPIHDLTDALESYGIRVFLLDFVHEEFDGLSTVVNDLPIIVISSRWPGDRQRFTLAHELGHFLFKDRFSEDLNEETVCNRFAGAFLFPREAVFQKIGRHRHTIELRELMLLKEEYKLSMSSICYRMYDLGIIKEPYFKKLKMHFKKKGWNKKEPGEQIPSEKAHVFKQMVFHALGEDFISESKAAELLRYPLDRFRSFRLMEDNHASTY